MSVRRQIDLLICAVQFLTRLPTPRLPQFQSDWITRSARYFPVVGQIVGVICAAVWSFADRFWPGGPAAVLAVAAGILTTGGFHEDGLADTADGLGGGQNREAKLLIMKDSRLGSFGALAIGAVCLLKILLLARLTLFNGAWTLIALHGGGRAAAVVVMAALPYAGDPDTAKSKPAPQGVTAPEAVLAVTLGAWPLFAFTPGQVVFGLAAAAIASGAVAFAARRLVGGVTGDILGAVEQLAEVGLLLGLTA